MSDRNFKPTCSAGAASQLAKHPHVHFASQSSDVLESSRPGNGQATRQKVGKVDLIVITGQSSKHSAILQGQLMTTVMNTCMHGHFWPFEQFHNAWDL